MGTDTWIYYVDNPMAIRKLSAPDSSKEDLRLFHFNGRLFGSYQDLAIPHIFVNICEFGDDLDVWEIYQPRVPEQQQLEKNWQFFEHNGQLFFVYSIEPHIVYSYDFAETKMVAREEHKHGWKLGMLRGGTPPILVGDRFLSLFHSVLDRKWFMGWYEFEAKPPFKVIRVGDKPILEHVNTWCHYPMSLLHRNGEFTICYGEDDCRIRLLKWKGPDA
jgi:hypothetical protein